MGGYEPPNFRRAVPEVGFSRENEKGGREDYRGEKVNQTLVMDLGRSLLVTGMTTT